DQRGSGFPRIYGAVVDIGAFEVQNLAPNLTCDQAGVTVNEGSPAANSGTFGDESPGTVTLTASVGTLTRNDAAGTWAWAYTPPNDRGAPNSVTITATDAIGQSTTVTFGLTVNNVAPTVTEFSVPATAKEGDTVTLSGTATDPGTDTLGYQWVIIDP